MGLDAARRQAPIGRPTRPDGRRAGATLRRPAGRRRRRLGLLLLAAALVVAVTVARHRSAHHGDVYLAPSAASLAALSVPQRIVALVESQVGYHTVPSRSYCNKFSAYWSAGSPACPSGERAEEWCADFAAWAWHRAGVPLTYGFAPGDLNAGAVSFYEWGVANGTWHPATSGWVPGPGDVAVYGLSLGIDPTAAHVAVVTADAPGQPGPDVVNGDGDRTGFSVVETGTDQRQVHVGRAHYALSGYVSLPPSTAP